METFEDLNLAAIEGINGGDVAPLIVLLRSGAPIWDDVLELLAALIDPSARTDWRLRLQRRAAGNRFASGEADDLTYFHIGYQVAFLRRHNVSYEGATAQVGKEVGVGQRRAKNAYRDLRKEFDIEPSKNGITLHLKG